MHFCQKMKNLVNWTRQFDLTTSIVSPIWGKYCFPQDACKSQSWTISAPTPPTRLSPVILSPSKPPSKEEPRIKRGRISSMQWWGCWQLLKVDAHHPYLPRHSSLYWQCCPWTAPAKRIIAGEKTTILFTFYFSFLWHLCSSFFNVQSTDHWRRLIHYPNNWTTKSKSLLPDSRYRAASWNKYDSCLMAEI